MSIEGLQPVAPARTAVIEIPMEPPREASPNFYGPWRRKAKAVRKFRECAGWATMQEARDGDAMGFHGRYEPVVLDAQIAWTARRKFADPTNASILLKAAIDGIADVLWDGRDDHVLLGEITQTRGQGVVTVTLTGREGG